MLCALGDAGRGKLLSVAALLDEPALQRRGLPVEQVIGLVNQADDGIGDDRGVRGSEPGRIIGRIRPIGRIGPMLNAHGANLAGFRVVLCPLGQGALAEEVLVVE